MSCMYPTPQRISFLSIVLLLTIMPLLNFILISFLLRIKPRREFFFKVEVLVASTQFPAPQVKSSVSPSLPRLDGIVV
uniref:Uncharacterized protein n=1 Tax=Arundo donax TaxID=35708 RepID=A0A0A8ZAJ1_ARUDO